MPPYYSTYVPPEEEENFSITDEELAAGPPPPAPAPSAEPAAVQANSALGYETSPAPAPAPEAAPPPPAPEAAPAAAPAASATPEANPYQPTDSAPPPPRPDAEPAPAPTSGGTANPYETPTPSTSQRIADDYRAIEGAGSTTTRPGFNAGGGTPGRSSFAPTQTGEVPALGRAGDTELTKSQELDGNRGYQPRGRQGERGRNPYEGTGASNWRASSSEPATWQDPGNTTFAGDRSVERNVVPDSVYMGTGGAASYLGVDPQPQPQPQSQNMQAIEAVAGAVADYISDPMGSDYGGLITPERQMAIRREAEANGAFQRVGNVGASNVPLPVYTPPANPQTLGDHLTDAAAQGIRGAAGSGSGPITGSYQAGRNLRSMWDNPETIPGVGGAFNPEMSDPYYFRESEGTAREIDRARAQSNDPMQGAFEAGLRAAGGWLFDNAGNIIGATPYVGQQLQGTVEEAAYVAGTVNDPSVTTNPPRRQGGNQGGVRPTTASSVRRQGGNQGGVQPTTASSVRRQGGNQGGSLPIYPGVTPGASPARDAYYLRQDNPDSSTEVGAVLPPGYVVPIGAAPPARATRAELPGQPRPNSVIGGERGALGPAEQPRINPEQERPIFPNVSPLYPRVTPGASPARDAYYLREQNPDGPDAITYVTPIGGRPTANTTRGELPPPPMPSGRSVGGVYYPNAPESLPLPNPPYEGEETPVGRRVPLLPPEPADGVSTGGVYYPNPPESQPVPPPPYRGEVIGPISPIIYSPARSIRQTEGLSSEATQQNLVMGNERYWAVQGGGANPDRPGFMVTGQRPSGGEGGRYLDDWGNPIDWEERAREEEKRRQQREEVAGLISGFTDAITPGERGGVQVTGEINEPAPTPTPTLPRFQRSLPPGEGAVRQDPNSRPGYIPGATLTKADTDAAGTTPVGNSTPGNPQYGRNIGDNTADYENTLWALTKDKNGNDVYIGVSWTNTEIGPDGKPRPAPVRNADGSIVARNTLPAKGKVLGGATPTQTGDPVAEGDKPQPATSSGSGGSTGGNGGSSNWTGGGSSKSSSGGSWSRGSGSGSGRSSGGGYSRSSGGSGGWSRGSGGSSGGSGRSWFGRGGGDFITDSRGAKWTFDGQSGMWRSSDGRTSRKRPKGKLTRGRRPGMFGRMRPESGVFNSPIFDRYKDVSGQDLSWGPRSDGMVGGVPLMGAAPAGLSPVEFGTPPPTHPALAGRGGRKG